MDWTTPVVAVAVAIVAASGTWLTVNATRAAERLRREDTQQKRIFKLVNYADQLRQNLEKAGQDVPPWPPDIYDQ